MRPILVAGKTGQLARCLVDVGRERALPIVAVKRPELDLEDSGSIDRVVNAMLPRAIVNAAAYNAVDMAESEPERAFAVNRDGARRLAASAHSLQIPFVHVSTDYVFDGRKSSAYCEDDAPCPLGVYGQSKLEGEIAVMDTNPDALVFRTSWVYSPYGINFLKTMLRLAGTRDVVRVVDDQLGAPTAASDIARAIVDALGQVLEQSTRGQAGIYHVTATGETTWYGFAKAIFDGWCGRGRRVPKLEAIATADYPSAVERPANSRLDCSKIERAFGIRLPNWSTSLGACLDVLAASRQDVQPC
jgi:dTDP-4-dehydrorhamnose reductase